MYGLLVLRNILLIKIGTIKKFIAENVKNFDEYSKMVEKYTLDYTEEITGISKENLKEMARMVYEADGTCVLLGEWV